MTSTVDVYTVFYESFSFLPITPPTSRISFIPGSARLELSNPGAEPTHPEGQCKISPPPTATKEIRHAPKFRKPSPLDGPIIRHAGRGGLATRFLAAASCKSPSPSYCRHCATTRCCVCRRCSWYRLSQNSSSFQLPVSATNQGQCSGLHFPSRRHQHLSGHRRLCTRAKLSHLLGSTSS